MDSERNDQAPKTDRNKEINKWRIVSLALELGFIIALPLVLFGLAGKWLDGKMNTYPWLTLGGILFAIALTTVWLVRRMRELMTHNDNDDDDTTTPRG